MSRRKRNRQEDADKADIDLTPMLDVVFIMLIFFIVTASFVKEQTINVNVPDPNQAEQPPNPDSPESILIVVSAQNDITIDGRRVDLRAVRSLVAQKKAESPESSVVVRAHEDSSAEIYVGIADAAYAANVGGVSLVPYNDKKKR
ncbi:ExbD/TolR family protein [Marinagarivorans algicola]|uniref:ExbD/TolR family protein n=1 Tax=Marinagarivorans algicola TaxID=1513270 RepID=UPI0006B544DD|nr:biopolymer transporter ExbD [Marinagarivorans algicola]